MSPNKPLNENNPMTFGELQELQENPYNILMHKLLEDLFLADVIYEQKIIALKQCIKILQEGHFIGTIKILKGKEDE